MSASKERTSHLREDFRVLRRAMGEVHRLEPFALPAEAARGAFEALSPFVGLFFSARLLSELMGQRRGDRLTLLVLLTIGLTLLCRLLCAGIERLHIRLVSRLEFRELHEVEQTLLHTDYENLENPAFQNLKRDYWEARNMNGPPLSWALCNKLFQLVKSALTVLVSVILVIPLFVSSGGGPLASPWLSMAMAGLVGCASYVSMFLNRRQSRQEYRMSHKIIHMNRGFFYYVNNILFNYRTGKEIRLFREQDLILTEIERTNTNNLRALADQGRLTGRYQGLSAALSALLSGAVYLFVGLKALAGAFAAGMVIQYVGAIREFTDGFTGLAVAAAQLRGHTRYLEYYFNLQDVEPVKPRGTLPVEKRDDNQYELEFRHVSFRYPGSEDWALRDFSIRLRVGQRLAVVGRNGSGKTTFIKLLCRLYDPTEGVILLNGIDIRKYNIEEYLSIFSVVFQDFRLFSLPLGQNVAAGADMETGRAADCLRQAGFHMDDTAFPQGLDTLLYRDFDDSGVEISGGEAQKIALARALYKDAPFIILDEPTAALDPIAEFQVYSRFNDMVGSKTAVYISHRLSSCRFCDNIAVFDRGQLVQRGNHDELMAEPDGLYAQLWHAQAQYYAEEEACFEETGS